MNNFSVPTLAAPPSESIDHVAICHRLAGYDFPWELNRSLELAVLKTFCVPRISHLLRQTGKFERHPQKRYDDTSLILGNILKWGYDSPQGQAAIHRMNRIHRHFEISNEDYLYVLSTIIYEPIRWNQHFGWRPFSPTEKHALFQFWRVVGQRMGLQNMPETNEAFRQFNLDYEARQFAYHPDNAAIGDAVVALIQGWFPAIAAPLVPIAVKTVADDAMRTALGWACPAPMLSQGILGGLWLRQQLARYLPRRQQSSFVIDQANMTYPQGYQIEELGADATVKSSRCPFMRMRAVLKGEL